MSVEEELYVGNYSSPEAKKHKLYVLRRFQKETGLTANQLVHLDPEEYVKLMQRVVQKYVAKGKVGFAKELQSVAKTFYAVNTRTRLLLLPSEKVVYVPPLEKHVPSVEQVRRMARAAYTTSRGIAKWRNRAIILCLLASGVRVNCLVKWDWQLLKDEIKQDWAILRITRRYDTKIKASYYTFLAPWALYALRSYIARRVEGGWHPQPEDAIFVAKNGKPLKAKHVRRMVRRVGMQVLGVPTTPHAIRRTFNNVVSHSGLTFEEKELLMGHKLPGVAQHYFDFSRLDRLLNAYKNINWDAF
ncbi:MAG: site-specific integrase [Candidatus Freyarchaeota archaeon]